MKLPKSIIAWVGLSTLVGGLGEGYAADVIPEDSPSTVSVSAVDYDLLVRAWQALKNKDWDTASKEITAAQAVTGWPIPALDIRVMLAQSYLHLSQKAQPLWPETESDPIDRESAAFNLGLVSSRPLHEASQKATAEAETTKPPTVSPPAKSGVGAMKELWQQGDTPAAARRARSVIFNTHLKGCQPEYAYAQFVLARVKRSSQDRKGFDDHQMRLMRELDKSTCKADSFAMTEDDFEQFVHEENLWAARLDWENSRLKSAQTRAQKALENAVHIGSASRVLDALAVLSGRILYETLNDPEHLGVLDQLETKLRSRELFKDALAADLSMRRALLAFEGRDYTTCTKSAQFANEVIAAQQENPGQRRELSRSLFWTARCASLTSDQNSSSIIRQAWNKIHSIDALGFYSMRMAMEFPELQISEKLKKTDPFQISKRKPIRSVEFTRRLEAVLSMLDRSITFKTLPRDSLIRTKPLTWLMNELRDKEFDLYHADQRLLQDSLKWMRDEGHIGPSILSAGRLASEFRMDHPKARFIREALYPDVYAKEFFEAQQFCSVDALVLYSVTRQESLFGERAVSHAGARGLMQLMPSVWSSFVSGQKELNLGKDPFDPRANTIAGACHLREALAAFNGNLALALAGYNAGVAAVKDWVERRHQGDIWLFVEMIPYAETQNYVRQILRSVHHLQGIRLAVPEETANEFKKELDISP